MSPLVSETAFAFNDETHLLTLNVNVANTNIAFRSKNELYPQYMFSATDAIPTFHSNLLIKCL